jgi:predicted Zn-dependent peptidase
MNTALHAALLAAQLLSTAAPTPAATTTPTAPASFRQSKPQTTLPAVSPLPKPERFRVAALGLDVMLIEAHELPTVTVSLTMETGAVFDPPATPGLRALSMSLMSQGTARLDKVAFEEAQADLASSVWVSAGLESSSTGFTTLKRNLQPTVALWLEMVTSPGLREGDLNRLKSQRKASIAQSRGAPQVVASRVMGSIQFPGHAYGAIESEATVDAISLAAITDVVRTLGPRGGRLYVTGDMTRAEVEALINDAISTWPGSVPERKRDTRLPAPRTGTVFFVDVKGAPQSTISVMTMGPARTAADYEATELMAMILGGSFSSRINMNLREKNGYAYGARAGYRYRLLQSTFAATSSVRTDATGKALRELHHELMRMRSEAPAPDELSRDQRALVLSLPAQFSTPRRLTDAYGELAFYGLPLDWYDGRAARLQRLDAAAVLAQAKQLLPATGYQVLVVGDGAAIRAEVEAIAKEGLFGKGGLVVLDADGGVVR